jgi:hypothetical protein
MAGNSIHDYLIDHDGFEWPRLLADVSDGAQVVLRVRNDPDHRDV